jgi:uncharacterized protein
MRKQRVNIEHQGKIVVEDILVADNFWMRLSGYMFRRRPHVAGILFKSSGSIQTSFMRFSLDIIFLTKANQI